MQFSVARPADGCPCTDSTGGRPMAVKQLRQRVSRRRVMALLGGSAAAVALAACGETQVVTKEVPVETTVIKESRKSRSRRS
jgi:hypothetical protein